MKVAATAVNLKSCQSQVRQDSGFWFAFLTHLTTCMAQHTCSPESRHSFPCPLSVPEYHIDSPRAPSPQHHRLAQRVHLRRPRSRLSVRVRLPWPTAHDPRLTTDEPPPPVTRTHRHARIGPHGHGHGGVKSLVRVLGLRVVRMVVAGEDEGGRGLHRGWPLEKAADESRIERKNVNTRHLAGWEPTPLPGPHLNTASADRLGAGVPPCCASGRSSILIIRGSDRLKRARGSRCSDDA